MFKESVIQNKKKRDLQKRQRLSVVKLRNRFLGEWASSILGLNKLEMQKYVSKLISIDLKDNNNKNLIKKIVRDFDKKNVKISYKEIEFKSNDFQIKANVIVENKLKLSNWK